MRIGDWISYVCSSDRQSTLICRDCACIVGSLLQLLTSRKVSHSLIESGDLLLGHLAGWSLRRRLRRRWRRRCRRCCGLLSGGGLLLCPSRGRSGRKANAQQGGESRPEEHTSELQSLMLN